MRRQIAIAALGLLSCFAQSGQAADPLQFFKNYFVTGDYVVGGVGLRGLGDGTGFATGTISIPDTSNYPSATFVPDGADIVAAFLYWQTVEKSQSQLAGQNGFFGPVASNGSVTSYAIAGTILGNPNAPTSWSSGGCSGSSNGTTTLRTYRADVRPFLPVANGRHQANGKFQVRLADSGSNGGGAPLTLGATLVIIYRLSVPPKSLNATPAPLNVITIYDGAFAPSNSSSSMSQTIQGFYQADASPVAKLTHLVGNGQPNKDEELLFNGTVIAGSPSSAAFPGLLNGSWDNPTFTVSPQVPAGDTSPLTTSVIPTATNSGCVSWAGVIFSTTVPAGDSDGLLPAWKTMQGYNDVKDGSLVPLPGATQGQQDLFIQLDYLVSHDFITNGGTSGHSHLPKQAALDMVGDAFAAQGIHLHIDCNNCYPGDPYVINSATGGNIIDENAVACQDNPAATPPFYCEFPGEPAISWKGGFTLLKNQPLNYPDEASCEAAGTACIRRFPRNRKDTYHEVIFGHELGLATTNWSVGAGTLTSISVSSNVATITTACPPVPAPCPPVPGAGVRVSLSGALLDFDLNGTYIVQSAPSSTTFTINTTNVKDGTYNSATDPGLLAATGPATSNSGWSDLGGGDTLVTFGNWRFDDPSGCQPNPAAPLTSGQVYCNDRTGSVQAQAGTLLHELGHTLGLTHGGAYLATTASATPGISATYGLNCKPNFQSVMSYQFQIRGLPGFDGLAHVNYSGQILPDLNGLNEGNLSEPAGIGASATTYRTRWFAPLVDNFVDMQLNTVVGGRAATAHCNGTPLAPAEVGTTIRLEGPLAGPPAAPIDWNNDGNTTDTSLVQDINFNGSTADSTFAGFNDWANIDLRQIGARRGVLGFSTNVWGSADTGGGGSADSGGGGSADTGGGGSADSGGGGSADSGGGGSADSGGGGSADSGGGGSGSEGDFDLANSTVDPPIQLTCVNCAVPAPGSLVENGKSVLLNWMPPGFGRIRTYYVWRANITSAPMSATNRPVNIGQVGSKTATTPPATSFSDGTIKNNNIYTYFVTAALGNDSGPLNSRNQSGACNMVTMTVNFTTKNSTTTSVASSLNPSTFGQSVTFTATVSPSTATGTVTFKDGSATLGSGALGGGTATFVTSGLPAGAHSITVVYGGDTNNSGSTSAAISQIVSQGSSKTVLAASATSVSAGGVVTFTATVSPVSPATVTPTGTVTFLDGAASLGTAPLNSSGVATLSSKTLTAGTHSITASYGGDGNYSGSVSPPLSVAVTNSDFSISASPGTLKIKAGGTAQYTVTITGSGGFSEAVSLIMVSSPAGPTAVFSPATVSGGSGSTTMTVTVPAKGNFTLTITGTSSPSGLAHSTTVTVNAN